MTETIEILMAILIGGCAFTAIHIRDLLASVIILGAFSFLICLLWAMIGAIDVAFTEASVGAGISTVLLISGIYRTTRRTSD